MAFVVNPYINHLRGNPFIFTTLGFSFCQNKLIKPGKRGYKSVLASCTLECLSEAETKPGWPLPLGTFSELLSPLALEMASSNANHPSSLPLADRTWIGIIPFPPSIRSTNWIFSRGTGQREKEGSTECFCCLWYQDNIDQGNHTRFSSQGRASCVY